MFHRFRFVILALAIGIVVNAGFALALKFANASTLAVQLIGTVRHIFNILDIAGIVTFTILAFLYPSSPEE
jgi:hypothetical protein